MVVEQHKNRAWPALSHPQATPDIYTSLSTGLCGNAIMENYQHHKLSGKRVNIARNGFRHGIGLKFQHRLTRACQGAPKVFR